MTARTHAPAWVFYDGTCGFCHGAVRFCLRRDPDGSRFRFAPSGQAAWRERLPGYGPQGSMVVLEEGGPPRLRSSATVALLRRMGGGWRVLGALLWLVPWLLRDLGYRLVARVRHRLASRPDSTCPVLEPALRARFDLRA